MTDSILTDAFQKSLLCALLLLFGCTYETTSQRDYEPWKESARDDLRQRDISVDQISTEVDRGDLTDQEIQELRDIKSYVRKNLPVDEIRWTYKLKQAGPIVQTWLGPQYIYAETKDFHLYAIDRKTGNPEWMFSLHGRIEFRPTFVKGVPSQKIKLRNRIESLESKLDSVRAETGNKQERIRELTSQLDVARNRRQQLINVDRVYLVVGTTLYVLDREFGSQIDRVQLDFSPASQPYANRDRVVIPGYYKNYVHFLDASNFSNQIQERVRMEEPVEIPIRSVKNLYLLATDGGVLYALNQNQEWQWVKETDGPIAAPPAVWKDQVYLASKGMQIYGLSRFTGRNIWTHQLSTPISTTPWISPPNVYVRDEQRRLHAFDLKEGDKKWMRTNGPNSFLFRNKRQVITHNPSEKKVYVLSDESGKTLSTGQYKRFDYIHANSQNPFFLLADRNGNFVSARASTIGIAWDQVGPDPAQNAKNQE